MRQSYLKIKAVMFEQYVEKNFCTVAAIAMAMDWSAGKAHRYMARHGRPRRGGPSCYDFHKAVESLEDHGAFVVGMHSVEGTTLNRFCKEHPEGTFIVMVKGHALTVIDGVPQDWTAETAGKRKIGYRTGKKCCWAIARFEESTGGAA